MKRGIFLFLASCLALAVGCAGQGAAPGSTPVPTVSEKEQQEGQNKEEPSNTKQVSPYGVPLLRLGDGKRI